MKRIFTLCIALCSVTLGFAQDSTVNKTPQTHDDTIHIGGMIIIRKPGGGSEVVRNREARNNKPGKTENITTNFGILDLGFSNYTDNTNYSGAAAQAYAPGSNKTWFDLKDGKSRNINIWFFMQRINMVSHVVNFKYGLGLELNNYRYKQNVRFVANTLPVPDPPRVILDATAGRTYKKDKLAADYLTAPFMLNFNFTPKRHKDIFGFSGGISVGYMYSTRNKTITSDEHKKKAKDDFEIERWKLSYVGELSLGPVKFYGSYAFKNMFSRGFDMTPFTFGFRFSKI